MASGIYNIFKRELAKGTIDLVNDTIKVGLLNNSHVFDPDTTADEWSDISSNEIVGAGYSSGGQALTGKGVTAIDASDLGKFDADDALWPTSSIAAYHAVLYDDTTTPKYLIASFDFGGLKNSSNGAFTITWNSSGIITLT